MRRLLLGLITILYSPAFAAAQGIQSAGVAAGVHYTEDTRPTAAFAASASVRFGISWLFALQRSLADLETDTIAGTERDISVAVLPVWQPLGGRVFLGAGAALTARRMLYVGASDTRDTRVRGVAIAGIRIPVAGEGLALELSGRADQYDPISFAGLFGMRVRFGAARNWQLGEPLPPATVTRAAVWNDVLMQLILLQQNLESFTRIKEIETGIELEFESGSVTLWDDVAKVGRVLAAADPPVIVTAFGPNAGRVAAAVTAGTFPPERLKLQRNDRVYLRVEH
ncbi:MAG TPA: hypothetical protein VGD49_04890 [Longimicrobiales bacterium]